MGAAEMIRNMQTRFTHEMKTRKGNGLLRWATLACVFVVVEIFLCDSARAQSVSREAVLRDIAQKVIAPGYQELATKCAALTNAAAALAQAPDQASLDKARQSWVAMAEAANRVRCYQAGPIVDREYVASFFYSRISQPGIESDSQSTNEMNQAYVTGLGGTTKGMFALEYLLFGHRGYPGNATPNTAHVLETFSGDKGQRRLAFVLALAMDLESKAAQLAQDWTATGEQSASGKFVAGGQSSISVVVNQLAHAIEDVEQARLNFVLFLPPPIAQQLYRVEACPSGTSLQDAVARVEGIEKFYRGAGGLGLSDALKQVNAPLDKRILEQFETTLTAIKDIGEPLDQAAVDKRPAVQNACDKAKALEILFKVDLASGLGVTISFTSGDGD
jgi:predicted lipoprotein